MFINLAVAVIVQAVTHFVAWQDFTLTAKDVSFVITQRSPCFAGPHSLRVATHVAIASCWAHCC